MVTKDHKVDLPPHQASFRIFFDCEFNVNPGYNSMQLPASIKQHVSLTRDVIGQECTPETYPHRIFFTGMFKDKLHRNDEANLQNAQGLRDFAAHFRPGYRVVVSPGSESRWTCDKWLTEHQEKGVQRSRPEHHRLPDSGCEVFRVGDWDGDSQQHPSHRRWQAASSCCADDGGLGEQGRGARISSPLPRSSQRLLRRVVLPLSRSTAPVSLCALFAGHSSLAKRSSPCGT